jgi:hydrogenase maturation protease
MPTPSHILVLGLGNILLTDEGLGVRAVERLAADYDLPANVEVLDGGTLGLDLLPRLEGVEALLLVDAVKAGGQPGDLVRLAGDDIQAALAVKMSVHQVGLQELLAVSAFQGTRPPRVVLWGMEPAALEWGLELSPPVAARLDALVEAISQELRAWGGVTGRTGDLAQIELPKVAMTLAADETSGGNLLAAEPIPPTTLKAAPSYTAHGHKLRFSSNRKSRIVTPSLHSGQALSGLVP